MCPVSRTDPALAARHYEIIGQSTTERMAEQMFRRFGRSRTSMVWRPDSEADHATGYAADGTPVAESRREHPDAAGSMTRRSATGRR